MKKTYIALSFLAISTIAGAQNKTTKSADKLFARYEFVDAAKAYEKLADNGKADGYVYKQLADCYYNMFDASNATKWYAKATETSQDAETYFRYAQMLKAAGKYDEANKQMNKFASMAPNDMRAKSFKENPNYVPKLLDKNPSYNVNSMTINSAKSDFGAFLYNDELYFTSARNTARKIYGWNDEPFLDIYRSILSDDGTFSEPTTLASLNSAYHDGPLCIAADGKTCYLTSDSFRENEYTKQKQYNLKLSKNFIYRATKVGDTWGNIQQLPFNSTDYSCANPSLSKDGKTLYFASNMPGSLGGVDIWKVSVDGETFGTPVNLGSKVNTEGNESFPFISDDGKTLYFSSNGKQGLGGYDVYKVDVNGGEASNLGKPVNSEKDDFAFTFNTAKNKGFFSSNREGEDNIYAADPICAVDIKTIVTNAKTGEILPGSKVTILDDKGNVIATEIADNSGIVHYNVECNKAFKIQASQDKFESGSFDVAKSKGPTYDIAAKLKPIEEIVQVDRVVLNEIYFEFNKANITQQGAFELDKLVQVMNSHKDMVILVKSHTDSRGSDAYNMDLSDRRAKATVQYVVSKGISADRISGKGMGESEPKVACGKNCTEEQHAQNRRSEFLIVKQ